jgi:nucleotide-binding universal stress UspA family protein
MYGRLLVAVDHSESARRVIEAARDLAHLATGEVWVLCVREEEIHGKVPAGMGMADSEAAADARATVDDAVAQLRNAGVTAHGEVRTTVFGHAAMEIVDGARSHDVGVIVMGSRGRGDLAGLVLGSTAHKVIHLAERPVLVVR